ncbi:MAG: PhnE/PtxC family ABC transporter permease [Phycisphaerales bacterium JB063]
MVMLSVGVAGLLAAWYLGLSPANLVPAPDARGLVADVFGSAVSPAVAYESDDLPPDIDPLLVRVAGSALRTVVYAAAAMSLVVGFGVVLGFFSSTAWWADEPVGAAGPVRRLLQKTLRPAVYAVARVLIAVMRSTHEMLWAVLFMAAMGLTPLAAVIALAIPHTGILAKIFGEMVDEAPRDSAKQLRDIGATPLQQYLFGLLPRARNDLVAYGFYRFECIIRGSAVLGFFGIETIGKYIKDAFENNHYHEMWTYIYALLILVVVFDLWSGVIRRRLS